MEDIFRGVGIEITLPSPDNFLKVKETLTRMGIASKRGRILYQSCNILHRQGRYVILHFKELFILDGKKDTFSDDDMARRDTIVKLLDEWGLVKIVDISTIRTDTLAKVKILSHNEKSDWILENKYSIGKG